MKTPCCLMPTLNWVVCLLLSVTGSPLAAQEVISREYETKAGVISLLGKFVTWPDEVAPSAKRPLTIGVLGQDPFFEQGANQLDQAVVDERTKGRTVIVRRFDSAKDYLTCHILYVSAKATEKSEEQTFKDRLVAAVKLTNGKPVLLMGDATGLSAWGTSANMLYDRQNNRLRLELNPEAAKRHDLKFSLPLLRLEVVEVVLDVKN